MAFIRGITGDWPERYIQNSFDTVTTSAHCDIHAANGLGACTINDIKQARLIMIYRSRKVPIAACWLQMILLTAWCTPAVSQRSGLR